MKINQLKLFISAIILIVISTDKSLAQGFNADNYKIFYNFKTVKQIDNKRLFEVSFVTQNAEDKLDEMPVFKAEIKFLNVLGEQEVLLGSVLTSKEGIAQLILPENQTYLKDSDGRITVRAKFEATDALEEQLEEISFKDLTLEFGITEIDSVRTISVNAYTLDNNGESIPVEAADIAFYVQGMLSKLKIEEGAIEQGVYEFEYVNQIPGDDKGNLTFYAMIEESDDFANVIQMKKAKFGTIIEKNKMDKNALWADAAPIWMYIVLSILLIGVYSNFAYSIVNLFKIRNEKVEPES